jgi:hypothetical protein
LTPLAKILPLDDNITFHKIIFGAITLATFSHMLGHYMDFRYFAIYQRIPFAQSALGTWTGLSGKAKKTLAVHCSRNSLLMHRTRYFGLHGSHVLHSH